MRSPRTGGIALIAVILLVIIASIVIMGIASLLSNSIYSGSVEIMRAQALAAAQAGVYAAIADYSHDSLWDKPPAVNVSGNIYYSVGGGTAIRQADFLLVDASNSQVPSAPNNTKLQAIPLTNINAASAITVNQLAVDWNFGGTLTGIALDAGALKWTGASGAPTAALTLSPNLSINAGVTIGSAPASANRLEFSSAIPSDGIIVATFYFSDGSSRKAILYNGVSGGNNEFLITSTGEVRSTITWKRTIEATYDVGTTKITSWQETESHL